MPPVSDSIRSTFPIPDGKLRARKWKIALGSPVTWAPYLPVVGALTFLDVGLGWFAALFAVVTAGVSVYWKTHTQKLENKLLEELIAESNDAQDRHLAEVATGLSQRGYNDYASTMGSFLNKKQKIEKAIHAERDEITSAKREVERLTDAVAFGVSDQLTRLADLDDRLFRSPVPLTEDQKANIEQARSAVSEQVHSAWNTLEDTWQNLSRLLDPSAGIIAEDATHLELDRAIDRLKREQEIASRVSERMSSEWSDAFGSPIPLEDEVRGEMEGFTGELEK